MRLAADELLVAGDVDPDLADDAHAIVERETSFASAWLDGAETEEILATACEWEPPVERPALAQGALAGIPVKLWLEADRSLLVVPAGYAVELTGRLWGGRR